MKNHIPLTSWACMLSFESTFSSQPSPRPLRFSQGRGEQLVMTRKGPWEGYFSSPPSFARISSLRERRLGTRQFSSHMRNMGNAAEYFMFFKWKSKILVCLCIFYKKKIGVKNNGTILSTNHFDLRWKENSLIKIDWDPVKLSRKTIMISTKPRCPPGGIWVNFR